MAPPLCDAKFLLSEVDPSKVGACAAEIAFVGRSNVGKSSLLNALCGRDLAKVSRTPGRTQTINVFAIKDRWIIDLPGYGFAKGPAEGWSRMIEAYLAGRPRLKMVFALIDSKVGPTQLDHQMLAWLKSHSLPRRIVATKIDQVGASRRKEQREEVARALVLPPADIGWVSARSRDGIHELRAEALALLNG